MAKLKIDVSGVDPEKSVAGAGEKPRPGVYHGVLVSADLGYKKGDDGKPDKSAPRLEPIFKIVDAKAKSPATSEHPNGQDANGTLLYDYINVVDESSTWKLDQFLMAAGILTPKKRTANLDTDKLKDIKMRVRVKADTYNGEYSAKVGAWLAAGTGDGDDADEGTKDDDFEELGGGEKDSDDDDGFEDFGGGDDEPEAAAEGHTEESLKALEPKEVAKIAKEEFGINPNDIPGKGAAKVAKAIEMILEAQDDDPFADS